MQFISASKFPLLYKAAILCMLDNGCINRLETQPSVIETAFTEETLNQAEVELLFMTPEQLDTFCTGEDSEVCQMVDDLGLLTADCVIQELVG